MKQTSCFCPGLLPEDPAQEHIKIQKHPELTNTVQPRISRASDSWTFSILWQYQQNQDSKEYKGLTSTR